MMQIDNPDAYVNATELEIMERTLPLREARVLELGCGRAWMTRRITEEFSPAAIIATEVDRIQHEKNLLIDDLPTVTFVYGGAQAIEQPDDSMDVVLMLKSLHHVPMELMDQALDEIARVLKPGGLAYISEPVFRGELNEITRLYNDEETVRQAAFDAVHRAVTAGKLELKEQLFFNAPGHYRDFEHFENRMLKVTHTEHRIDQALYERIREAFMQHMTKDGARFLKPSRVDLLRKTA
jgi:ubiquinone/menaquinone biosynthesis C-methylase UbiE